MATPFQFKQFSVDQSGCAMKINTDGVLLGAMASVDDAKTILDIGTGTGVIALMMAQKFPDAIIEAVELDISAAKTAGTNFTQSGFAERLSAHSMSFEEYFGVHPERKYDLIISNPPFYINSLQAPDKQKNMAKHAGHSFFVDLIRSVANHLTLVGQCWLVLPLSTAELVKTLAVTHKLNIVQTISIHSFEESEAHREIIALSFAETKNTNTKFVIYDAPKVYSLQYRECLKDFFTIF